MSEIEQIKEKIDIVEFISQFISLKKAGRNFKALCPFHSEKSPSFIVSPERQIWYCFGACSEGGDIFKFLMKWENLEFPEALKDLAKKAGVVLGRSRIEDKEWKIKERLYEINHLTCEYYHFLLREHKIGQKARSYLKNREIKEKTFKIFKLGYAPLGWRNVLLFLKKKGYKEEEIEKAGLIIKGTNRYYDRFRGRLIFPLKDSRGNTVGFSGRLLEKSPKEAKYINTPETPLYQKRRLLYGLDVVREAIRKKRQAIISEGEFDVLSSFQAGITNTVALKGTALTNEQLSLLRRYTEEVVLALDMDLAGDAAARRGIELADSFGFNIKIVKIPQKNKDIDEALKKDPLKVRQAIKNALPVYDFLLKSACYRFGGKEVFLKRRISEEVVPFYAKITNPIIRSHYVKKLAKVLEVSEEAVMEEIEREIKSQKSPHQNKFDAGQAPVKSQTESSKIEQRKKTREEILEEHLLSLIIQSKKPKEHLKILKEALKIEELTTPAVKRTLEIMEQKNNLPEDAKGQKIKEFAKTLPKELIEVFNRCYLVDLTFLLAEEKKFEKEFAKTTRELKKIILKKKLLTLSIKMREGKDSVLEGLNQEFNKLSLEVKKLQDL